jgi:protein-S-isoprenylcysteine O-methyltransferase Ste14
VNTPLDRARIIAPPPLLALACILFAFLARHFIPLRLFARSNSVQIAIGILMLAAAIVVVALARKTFIAHATHPNPYRPTKALVETGLFSFSRNPIYLAFLFFVIAFALLVNSFWFVMAAFVLLLLLDLGVVRSEENYLRAKFGSAYEKYCSRVRRWI